MLEKAKGPRFKIGDRVRIRVPRADAKDSTWMRGVVKDVDLGHLVPQYVIDVGSPMRVREFDLYPDEPVRAEG